MSAVTTPYVSDELTDWLKLIYPSDLPRDPVSEAILARKIGQQDVVRKLLAIQAEQGRQITH